MHSEDAPCVLAVLAGLLAEARGDAGVPQRQLRLVHPLVHVEPADGLLGGGDEILVLYALARHHLEQHQDKG